MWAPQGLMPYRDGQRPERTPSTMLDWQVRWYLLCSCCSCCCCSCCCSCWLLAAGCRFLGSCSVAEAKWAEKPLPFMRRMGGQPSTMHVQHSSIETQPPRHRQDELLLGVDHDAMWSHCLLAIQPDKPYELEVSASQAESQQRCH